MVQESDRGSYCQLNTYEDSTVKISNNGRQRRKKGSQARLLYERRTLFTRRDFILVSVVMVGAVLIIAVTLGLGLPRLQAKREKYFDVSVPASESQLYSFSSSAVLSDGEPCAAIGKKMLDMGGSAVDAAVAMVFCAGVVNPTSTGLGGGFLMTIYSSSTKNVEVIDAREAAPSAANATMYHGDRKLAVTGPVAIAVPGELRGLGLAHERHGKLNWSELVLPSVDLCRNGVPVSHYMAGKLEAKSKDILADPGLRNQFTNNETGQLYKEREVLKRPLLGDTLEKIAYGGPDVLYEGEMAETLAEEIQAVGGIITTEDLGNYTAKVRQPVSLPLRGGKDMFYSSPPPGSGAIVAAILNVLSGYNLTALNVSDIASTVRTFHHMIESYKFAFAQRSQLGDPDYVSTTQIVKNMTSPEFGSWIRSRITPDMTHPQEYYGSEYQFQEDHGTSHCQVLAGNGDAVSVTSTINTQFGAKFASPSTGIIFNDEMDDFSSPNITNYFGLPPSKANFIEAGKRPLSSMSPSLLVDQETGKVKVVIGGNGGTRIITSVLQVLTSVMWFDKNVKVAIDEPRFHHQLDPDYVQVEESFQEVYRDELAKLGHKTQVDPEGSVILGIVRTNTGSIQANVDHRKGGSAEGN